MDYDVREIKVVVVFKDSRPMTIEHIERVVQDALVERCDFAVGTVAVKSITFPDLKKGRG